MNGLMQRIMNFLMLSCKTASNLTDKRSITKLTLHEEVMLRVHTSMCEYCTAYKQQGEVLDEVLQRQIQVDAHEQVPVVSNDGLKDRLLASL